MIAFSKLRKNPKNYDSGTIAHYDEYCSVFLDNRVIAVIRKRYKPCLRVANYYSIIIGTVVVSRHDTIHAAKRAAKKHFTPTRS